MLPEPLRLADLPHCEAQRLLEAGATAWLCVNPVEYHGPHLSLHNDRLVSEGLSRRLHARLWPGTPLLFCDDLEVGVEPVPGPGTRAVPFATVRRLVVDAARAVRELGAKRVVFMTFHGAPLHNLAIHAGLEWLVAHGVPAVAPFHGLMDQLVEPSDALLDRAVAAVPPERRATARAELPRDYHAGTFETSLALWLAPASVAPVYRQLPDCPDFPPDPALLRASAVAAALGRRRVAAELRLAAWGTGWQKLRPFPGYTGRPSWATAEIGEAFADLLIDEYAAGVTEIFAGRRPHPAAVMSWLSWATLGGRLTPAHAR
jgi:creatinine amidohydrolase